MTLQNAFFREKKTENYIEKSISLYFINFFLISLLAFFTACTTIEPIEQQIDSNSSIALSEVGQKLMLRVLWDSQQRRAILDHGEHRIEIEPGSQVVQIDGEKILISSPAYLKNKEVYVPLDFYNFLKNTLEKKLQADDIPINNNGNANIIDEPAIENLLSSENQEILNNSNSIAKSPASPILPTLPRKETTANNNVSISKNTNLVDMSNFHIALDAGHGGYDPGAIGCDHISYEKNFTLDIVLRLSDLLSKHNTTLLLTRNQDIFISKEARVKFIEKNQADVLISIHLNSAAASQASGYEFWISPNRGNYNKNLQFSRVLQQVFKEKIKLVNREIRKNNFYVLTHTEVPAVLVEVCFMSNKDDLAWISKPESRQEVAQALYEGILRYYLVVFAPKQKPANKNIAKKN